MRVHDRGFSLVELAAVLAILGLVFAMSVPALWEILAEESLATASREIAGILTTARARAVFQNAEVGVKWVANAGDLVLTVYQDGNGNGVTTADIRKGVDRLVAGPYWLGSRYPGVNFSFVPGMDGTDPGGAPIGDVSDPVRFGRSDICSFSPIGNASPGTVYLSNRKHRQAAVRVTPTTAKIQIWTWHGKKLKWIPRW
ncbi:MAG TPA: prepilin-type N-terminal cleavage/methylation domain-containing protein [Thermoanaerobaculia bacterium]|nr:prepilin-type N-terminal cleavage/methylation domain-containing protein [Thermoanaerobaculia bacterium]